jgi:predicted enzyme related to lactoylglutathione lyase
MDLVSAVFYCSDIPATVDYYQKLGFKLDYQQDKKLAFFGFPNNVRLGVKKSSKKEEVPGTGMVFISVMNIEDLYKKVQVRGLTIHRKLSFRKGLGDCFTVLDPDQNQIQFVDEAKPAD